MRRIDSIPVLARAGSIIPLSRDEGNSVANPKRLDILAFMGNGEFELYEDMREFDSEETAMTRFESKLEVLPDGTHSRVRITSRGCDTVIPTERKIRVIFKDIAWENAKITVHKNGSIVSLPTCYYDTAAVELNFEMNTEYEIDVCFTMPSKLDELKERATDILMRAEIPNNCKHTAYTELMSAESVEKFISKANWGATLPAYVKDRLLETVSI